MFSLCKDRRTITQSCTLFGEHLNTLTVEVENLQNSKGEVQFALYNTDGSIPDEHYKNYFKMDKSRIENGKAEIIFSNLPK